MVNFRLSRTVTATKPVFPWMLVFCEIWWSFSCAAREPAIPLDGGLLFFLYGFSEQKSIP